MKKLTPTPNPNAEVWVPEDGVDRRTAASLEGAFQALLDRVAQAGVATPSLRVWGNAPGTFGSAPSAQRLTRSGTHAWFGDSTSSPTFRRWDLSTMEMTALTDPGIAVWLRANPYTGTLFAHGDTANYLYAVILRSTDLGNTWSTVLNDTAKQSRCVGFSPTTVLSVGANDIYLSTDDGLTWTAYTGTADGGDLGAYGIYDIRWDGSQWWMVADGRVLTSPDGIAWTSHAGGWDTVLRHGSEFLYVPGIAIHDGLIYVPTEPIYAYDTTSGTWVNQRIYGNGAGHLTTVNGRPTYVIDNNYGVLLVDVLSRQTASIMSDMLVANSELVLFRNGMLF